MIGSNNTWTVFDPEVADLEMACFQKCDAVLSDAKAGSLLRSGKVVRRAGSRRKGNEHLRHESPINTQGGPKENMYPWHRVRYTSPMRHKYVQYIRPIGLKLILFIFLAPFSISTPAYAGFNFEPYLGYWTGKLERDSNYYMATSGLLFGSRLGLGMGQLKFGADYMYSSGAGNQSGSTGDYSIHEYGPFVGLEMPGFVQLYASVFISSKAKIQPEVNTQPFTGSGFRIGIGGFGWARLRSVSLNLELISRSYNQYNNKNLSQKQKELSYALTVSMPFPGASSGYGGSSAAPDPSPSE